MLGSLILYLKGMRTTMFQLSGFYCTSPTTTHTLYSTPYANPYELSAPEVRGEVPRGLRV